MYMQNFSNLAIFLAEQTHLSLTRLKDMNTGFLMPGLIYGLHIFLK